MRVDLNISGVQPNHAWCHRFETLGRSADIRKDVVAHITGHAGADIAAEYGDYLIDALATAIEKIPRCQIPANVAVTP